MAARLSVLLLLAMPQLAWSGSSNSLLDISPDGTRLLAVNSDNGTVTLVDLKTRKAIREIAVGDKPEGVAWLSQGRVAAVTCYRDDTVVFFEPKTGKVLKKLAVADEPYGIVANSDGSRAWVTHEYPGLVSEIDGASQSVVRQMKAGEFVRGIALSPDESRLYVTEFRTAKLNALDLKSGGVVDSWKGQSVDNLCRSVVLHPKRPKAYLSHIRSQVEVIDGGGSIFPQVAVCDLWAEKGEKRRRSFGMDTYNGVYVVTSPWESALSPDGKTLYTVYSGTNDMNVSTVVDDDYQEIKRSGSAVSIGQNPRAVRVSPDNREVYIYNTLDFSVGVYAAQTMRRLEAISVCEPPKSPEWVRGKALFNTALPPLSSRRWIACASCHPDGHTDGRVWQNPEGLRKTTALFGMAHTHPLHWSADRDEAQDFEYTIRSKLMRGRGLAPGAVSSKQGFKFTELDEKMADRSKDLDALAIYCNTFDFTLSPHAAAPGKLSPAAERGKSVFLRTDVGCANCHSGPYYTDSRLEKPYKRHDVGTGQGDPSEKIGPLFDTPSLLGIYRNPPYLHHGKAATLRDVLTTSNSEDRHGKTSHLKPTEVDDLVEFLKSLPYERPPDETPNTVKYRYVPKEGS